MRRKFAKNEAVKATIEQFARKSGRKSGRIIELLKLVTETESEADISAKKALMASYHPRLIRNRVRYKRQIEEAHRFVALVKEYLSTEMDYVGYVRSDM